MSEEGSQQVKEEFILKLIQEKLEEKLSSIEKESDTQARDISSFKDEIEELIKISNTIQEKHAFRPSPNKKVPDLNLSGTLDDSTSTHQSQTLNGLISPAGTHGRKLLSDKNEHKTTKQTDSSGKKTETKDFGRRKPDSKEEIKEEKKDDKQKKNMLFDHVNKKDTKKQTKGKDQSKPDEKKGEKDSNPSMTDLKDETTADSNPEKNGHEEEKKEEPEREITDPQIKEAVEALKSLSKADFNSLKSIKSTALNLIFEAISALLNETHPKAKKDEFSTRKLQENLTNLVSLIKNYNYEGVSKDCAKKVKDITKKRDFNLENIKKTSNTLSLFGQWVVTIVQHILPPSENPEEEQPKKDEPKTPKATQNKADKTKGHEAADKQSEKPKPTPVDTKKGKDTTTQKKDSVPETTNPELKEAYKALSTLAKNSIKDILNLPNPASQIVGCFKALHVLLSGKELKDWSDLKKHTHVDDIVKKIYDVNVSSLEKSRIELVEKIIADEKLTEEVIKKKNPNTVPFYKFISAAISASKEEKINPVQNDQPTEVIKETKADQPKEEVKQEEPKNIEIEQTEKAPEVETQNIEQPSEDAKKEEIPETKTEDTKTENLAQIETTNIANEETKTEDAPTNPPENTKSDEIERELSS